MQPTSFLEARHYLSVVAMVTDALETEPENVALLFRPCPRSHRGCVAILTLRPTSATSSGSTPGRTRVSPARRAGRARRDEYESAAIFFRAGCPPSPRSQRSRSHGVAWPSWRARTRPVAAARFPANVAAAGRFLVQPADAWPCITPGDRLHGPDHAHAQLPGTPWLRARRDLCTPRHRARHEAARRGRGHHHHALSAGPRSPVSLRSRPPATRAGGRGSPRR